MKKQMVVTEFLQHEQHSTLTHFVSGVMSTGGSRDNMYNTVKVAEAGIDYIHSHYSSDCTITSMINSTGRVEYKNKKYSIVE